MNDKLSFEERCKLFPNDVIADLLKQITAQAKAIYELNLKLGIDPYGHLSKTGEILLKKSQQKKKTKTFFGDDNA